MDMENALYRGWSLPFRVTYRDTDQMGVVYHANYLTWLETGRTDLLRSMGQRYRDWEEKEGVYLPVLHCSLDFKQSARYDDFILVDTALTKLTAATCEFHYRVVRAEDPEQPQRGVLLAEGKTRHAFVDAQGRIVRAASRLLPTLLPGKQA